jgi:hypothetical protein
VNDERGASMNHGQNYHNGPGGYFTEVAEVSDWAWWNMV